MSKVSSGFSPQIAIHRLASSVWTAVSRQYQLETPTRVLFLTQGAFPAGDQTSTASLVMAQPLADRHLWKSSDYLN